MNKKLAGSALLQYPTIIEEILKAVVNAVDVPVTLKTRTGWDTDNKNCVQIAKLAEDCGIQALALHGRTKACMYKGEAEYDSIKAVKRRFQFRLSRMVISIARRKPNLYWSTPVRTL